MAFDVCAGLVYTKLIRKKGTLKIQLVEDRVAKSHFKNYFV